MANGDGESDSDLKECMQSGRYAQECMQNVRLGLWRRQTLRNVNSASVSKPAWARAGDSHRWAFWRSCSAAFHPDILIRPSIDPMEIRALKQVYDKVESVLFHWRPSDLGHLRDPPAEVFERISFGDLIAQYKRLRTEFIPNLLRGPEGMAIWTVESFEVELSCGRKMDVKPSRISLAVEPSAFQDRSLEFGSSAALGKRVLVRIPAKVPSILEGTLVGIRKFPNEAKLYKIVMTSDYCSIHEAEVWHIARVWHRVYMLGVTTEQLAEMVGSLLTKQVRARLGRKPRLGDVIGAVRLRSSGIWGDGCADGFLRRCLGFFLFAR